MILRPYSKFTELFPHIIECTVVTETKPNLKYTKQLSGGRLNKKDGLTRYGDSHVKDKTS